MSLKEAKPKWNDRRKTISMEKRKSGKKALKIALIGILALLGIGAAACGGFVAGVNYQMEQKEEQNKIDADIKENGIALKMSYATADNPYGSFPTIDNSHTINVSKISLDSSNWVF